MLFMISYHKIPWITISYIFCNKAKETLKSQNFKDYSGYVNKVLLKCQRKKYGTWRTQRVPAGSDPASKLQFCSTKGNDIPSWPNQGSVRHGSPSPWPSHWRDPWPLCACVWAQLCPTLCESMDCGPPGSSVHGIFRQEYWSGCHFLLQENLPDPGNEPASSASPALQADSLPTEQPGKPWSLRPPSYCSRLLTSSETLVPAIHPVWLPSCPLHLLKSHPGF